MPGRRIRLSHTHLYTFLPIDNIAPSLYYPRSFLISDIDPQAAWFLKVRALTEQTYVDEVEMEEEGIAELLMDDTAIADVASESVTSTRFVSQAQPTLENKGDIIIDA